MARCFERAGSRNGRRGGVLRLYGNRGYLELRHTLVKRGKGKGTITLKVEGALETTEGRDVTWSAGMLATLGTHTMRLGTGVRTRAIPGGPGAGTRDEPRKQCGTPIQGPEL